MQFIFIVLIVCFIVFLFALYNLSRDDFILLRKNVSMENVFNLGFVFGIAILFFARVVYVIQDPIPAFSNPLGFLLFPYYPGLSVTGGILGGLLFFAYLAWKKNYPIKRIFDFFSVSLLSAVPFGIVGLMILTRNFSLAYLAAIVVISLFLVTLFLFVIPRITRNNRNDGTIGFSVLIFISLVLIISEYFLKKLTLNANTLLLTLFILGSVGMLFQLSQRAKR